MTSSATTAHDASYVFHGLGLAVHTRDAGALEALAGRLGPFAAPWLDDAAVTVHLEPILTAGHTVDLTGSRPVYDTDLGSVGYRDADDRLLVDCPGLAWMDADLTAGEVHIAYAPDDEEALDLATHPLFTLALMEAVKRRGTYALHAACAAAGDRALLIAAPSGSGKTTLSVALSLAGWTFVADDLVFLRPADGEGSLDVLGFPDELDLTDDCFTRLPALAHLSGAPVRGVNRKHHVAVDAALAAPAPQRCRPSQLVFPELRPGRGSRLTELTSSDALRELLPNVLLTEVVSSQRHLDVLGVLAAQVPCARLELGTDLDQVVELLGARMGPGAGT